MGKTVSKKAPTSADFELFIKAFPAYGQTKRLDSLRAKDYREFEQTGEVYLDYTGGGRYGLSQIDAHMQLLKETVFGNPHSASPSSSRSTAWMEKARAAVLDYFQASADEYTVIFTPNASGALRLVGESYPFEARGRYLQHVDNHNSVNGIREFARRAGTPIKLLKSRRSDLCTTEAALSLALKDHDEAPHLFAYPAQSNFSGVQHDLAWIRLAQAEGWDVLLDAAAFVPTNRLDLQKYKPDYVSLSFYKMFGWPTGVGCLLARVSALQKLQRPWFAGGTIWAVSVAADWHVSAPDHEAFEDGTVNYLNLPAVANGLKHMQTIGIDVIHARVMSLTGWTLQQLQGLRHSNGAPLVEIYGPKDVEGRGATIACNFLQPNGRIIDERIIEQQAGKHHISLRTGCFCNPGSGETAFDVQVERLTLDELKKHQLDFDAFLDTIGLESAGAIRISFGIVSNFNDAEAFLEFAKTFIDTAPSAKGFAKRLHC